MEVESPMLCQPREGDALSAELAKLRRDACFSRALPVGCALFCCLFTVWWTHDLHRVKGSSAQLAAAPVSFAEAAAAARGGKKKKAADDDADDDDALRRVRAPHNGAPRSEGDAVVGSGAATTQLWSGADNVIVPPGFEHCDSSEMPPQIAPVRRAGDFLFLSGIVGYEVLCKSVIQDPELQIEKSFEWMANTLREGGSNFNEVVSVVSYHKDLHAHKEKFAEVRGKYFTNEPYPAWTAVQVSGLFYEGEVIELVAIAKVPPCNSLECN